ncbi:MAG TPA: tetratricopeptide repeat protein [Candidatus Polarisedimenticolia bacterium]|nr:tetratricopeptide repeat protein [Candidatus Polarisedimenticolia bacterium]
MGRKPKAPSRGPAVRKDARDSFLPPLFLLLISLLVYSNALFGGFVHDDKPLVAENRLLREPGSAARILTSGYWTTRDRSVPELYRPLTVLSLKLNYLAGRLSPFGYHFTNVLLHALVCWLVFRLALLVCGTPAAAWAAALLFCVHPVHVEAVAEVVGRSELLSTGFCLAALLLHVRARRDQGRPGWSFILPAACFLGALLSKESAVALPALILLTDGAQSPVGFEGIKTSRFWKPYFFYGIAALLFLAIRMEVLGAVARIDARVLDNPLVAMSRSAAWGTALIALGKYAWLLLWPVRLSADYSGSQIPAVSGPGDPRLLASVLFLVTALAWAFRIRHRWRAGWFSVLFFVAAILPVSNLFFPIGTIFGERLLYLPSVGFCLLAGGLLCSLRRARPILATLLLVLALVTGSVRTFARNHVWKDDASFALATARDAPNSPKAQFNLGVFLEEHGDLGGAREAYQRAAALAPDWSDTHFNLAGVLARSGRLPDAIESYRRVLALRPMDHRGIMNLGLALYQAGRHKEAIELYSGFLKERPDSAEAHNGLGANFQALGRISEAREAYGKAVALSPENVSYRLNLARAHEAAGDQERAVTEYEVVLRKSPDNLPALRDLGMILARRGQSAEASRLLRRAESLASGGLDAEALAVLRSLP